jgi:two-component system, response regulator RpfG
MVHKFPSKLRLVHSVKKTVLLVDDDAVSLELLTRTLRELGPSIRTHSFRSPTEMLEWARHSSPADLVLLDYFMPEMNGIQLLQAIRAIDAYRHVPVIMITVDSNRETLYCALEAGATDFLMKPIDPFECFARCRNLLALHSGDAPA